MTFRRESLKAGLILARLSGRTALFVRSVSAIRHSLSPGREWYLRECSLELRLTGPMILTQGPLNSQDLDFITAKSSAVAATNVYLSKHLFNAARRYSSNGTQERHPCGPSKHYQRPQSLRQVLISPSAECPSFPAAEDERSISCSSPRDVSPALAIPGRVAFG